MFPGRIDRIVLDANLDSLDHEAGRGGNWLLDVDKAFLIFQEERLANKRNCNQPVSAALGKERHHA